MNVSVPPAQKGPNAKDVLERMDGFRNQKIDAPEPASARRTPLLAFSCVFSFVGCVLLVVAIVVFCLPAAPLSCAVVDICNDLFKGAN